MTDRQELLAFATTLANILGQGKEQSIGPGKWRTYCPAHPDEGTNPSLEISVDENIRLTCRSRNCALDDILAGCRARGVPEFPQAKRFKSGGDYVINQVAHEEQPPEEWWLSRFQKVPDHVYIYRHGNGQPAFCVMRNDATEDTKKEIKPVCSGRPKKGVGADFWIAQAFPPKPKLRPLYNLPDLVSQPDAPVLVVEGEKTADAAKLLLPNYVIVTWAGGTPAVNTADWAPLTARDVTIWPDNDMPGIKCMKQLAGQIGRGKKAARAVRLVFDEEMTEFDKGFDLADEYKDFYPPLSEMLDNASDVDLSKMPELPEAADDEELAEKLTEFLEKYVAVMVGKDVTYVDVTHRSPHHSRMVPYLIYSRQALEQREVDTFLDMSGKMPKRKKFLEVYLESNKKRWLDGFVYDPSTTDRIVSYSEADHRLNLYCGMAWPPRECDPELYAPFINHIKNSCQTLEEAAYFMEWLAFKFQFPDKMIGTMIVLSGRQGCGKTIVCDIIKAILGLHNAIKIPMSGLDSQFNSQYCNKLFIDVEEYNPGASKTVRDLRERVKNLVTSETMLVNPKGIIAYENKAYHSIIATTNSPNPEEIGFDNRRMTFLRFDNPSLKVNGAAISDDEYFKPIVAMVKNPTALQGLCHYLSTLKINVGKVMKPFDTKLTEEAKASVDQPEWSFLRMLAETGELPDSEYLPKDDDNPYPISRWPNQAAALPRKILTQMYQDYCWHYRRETVTSDKAGRTLLRVLPSNPRGISDAFDITQTRRWEVVSKNGIDTQWPPARSICLPNQEELRELVEKAVNQTISWSKVTKDAGKSDDVVVEFPSKQF